MSHTVGVDTFTDCIVVGDDGRLTIGKAPSTPPDFETGFIDSLAAAAQHCRWTRSSRRPTASSTGASSARTRWSRTAPPPWECSNTILCDYTADYNQALLLSVGSAEEIPGGGGKELSYFVDVTLELRQFCCPRCQTLMRTEILSECTPSGPEMLFLGTQEAS